jgi:hypothetical protein
MDKRLSTHPPELQASDPVASWELERGLEPGRLGRHKLARRRIIQDFHFAHMKPPSIVSRGIRTPSATRPKISFPALALAIGGARPGAAEYVGYLVQRSALPSQGQGRKPANRAWPAHCKNCQISREMRAKVRYANGLAGAAQGRVLTTVWTLSLWSLDSKYPF